jgi:hypothetical protein
MPPGRPLPDWRELPDIEALRTLVSGSLAASTKRRIAHP